jgi:hypothetical protein
MNPFERAWGIMRRSDITVDGVFCRSEEHEKESVGSGSSDVGGGLVRTIAQLIRCGG